MSWPEPVTLAGSHVRLEALSAAHHDDLAPAVQDGELWRLWYTSVPDPAGMSAEIDRRLALRAKLDGVLRSHGVHADGSLRDTYAYSIIAAEWPAVRTHLEHLLARP